MLCDIAKIGKIYEETLKNNVSFPTKYFILTSPLKDKHKKDVLHVEIDLYKQRVNQIYVSNIQISNPIDLMLSIPKVYFTAQKNFPSLFVTPSGNTLNYAISSLNDFASNIGLPLSPQCIDTIRKQIQNNLQKDMSIVFKLYDKQKQAYVYPGEFTGFWEYWEQKVRELFKIEQRKTNNIFTCDSTPLSPFSSPLSKALKFATLDKKGFAPFFNVDLSKFVDENTFIYIFKGWELLMEFNPINSIVIIPSLDTSNLNEVVGSIQWAIDPNVNPGQFSITKHPELKYTILYYEKNNSQILIKAIWNDVLPSRFQYIQFSYKQIVGKTLDLQGILKNIWGFTSSKDSDLFENFGVGKDRLYIMFLTKLFTGNIQWAKHSMQKSYYNFYKKYVNSKQNVSHNLRLLDYINL